MTGTDIASTAAGLFGGLFQPSGGGADDGGFGSAIATAGQGDLVPLDEALGSLVGPSSIDGEVNGVGGVGAVEIASGSGLTISTADQSRFLQAGVLRLLAQFGTKLGQIRDADLLAVVMELIGEQVARNPSRVVVAHPGPPRAGILAQGAASFEVQTKSNGVREVELEGILVDPASRGRQIGTELMQAVWDIGRDEGATRMVLRAIPSAVPFYEKLGGEVQGSTGQFVEIHFNRRPGS